MHRKLGRLSALVALLVLLVAPWAPAQVQKTKGAAPPAPTQTKTPAVGTLELVGLQIVKPRPPAPENEQGNQPGNFGMMMGSMMGQPGTTITFSLTNPEKTILAVDDKASKLVSATDDKATNLTKETPGAGNQPQIRFGPSSDNPFDVQILPGGHEVMIVAHLPQTPARGWTKIQLKGQVALVTGSGEKTAEQKDLPLKGGKITVGPVPITVGDSAGGVANFGDDQNPSTMVDLTHSKPLSAIKSFTFSDANGKVIPHETVGSGFMGFGGQTTYTTNLKLEGKFERVSVKITYYEKTETLAVPLNCEVGVGF